MPMLSEQKSAIESVINVITTTTAIGRGKRILCTIFMSLVDRQDWPEYYEIIPEPRCLNNIKSSLEKNRYKDPLDVYTDLSLVFWNAMYYNEEESQIARDAESLKKILETEWKKHTVLPQPRSSSPPPQSAQKVHQPLESQPRSKPPTPKPAPALRVQVSVPQSSVAPSKVATLPIASGSIARQASPDIDIDIGGSPEPDADVGLRLIMQGAGQRDRVSDEIVNQLERSLPRWPGFGEEGWLDAGNQGVYMTIVHAVKSYKDVIGNRLSTVLEEIPESTQDPTSSSMDPLSLKIIENGVHENQYTTPQAFDKDMAYLFIKARRCYDACTEQYGNVLLLQRLYQGLTSPDPPHGPPYSSTTNFAFSKAGPGKVKPVHGGDGEGVPGVTNHRVLTRDKKFVDEVHFKGWTVKVADFLHLSNPDDPSRPIIAQVFRCWVSEEESKKEKVGVTVSWYFRPEQTYHPPNRVFWEGEVFKTSCVHSLVPSLSSHTHPSTGHFAEHPLSDIIEKISVQFTARHIRGRPRAPFWWPGFPIYVCDSRYRDHERVFVRIKNWNSCIPEEVRKNDEFMPIYPFERTVYPSRLASPFLSGQTSKGPGGLLELTTETEGDGESGRKVRKAPGDAGHTKASDLTQPLQIPVTTTLQQPYVSVHYQQQQQQQSREQTQTPIPSSKPVVDRSVYTAAGGQGLGNTISAVKLPQETTRHFDRDPQTNEVLWFSSPPVNVAPNPTPRHSLEYLHFLAKKRKAEMEGGVTMKRTRSAGPPSMLETLAAVANELKEKAVG